MKTTESFELNGSTVCHKIYDPEKDKELETFLKGKKLQEFIESIGEKIVLVLGGDGTMLTAIRENYEKDIPFLGINFGTLGFLLNDQDYIKNNSTYIKREYPLLNISNHGEHIGVAFNEVLISSKRSKFLNLLTTINDQSKVAFGGDGIIIATPAGSTAHNASQYGPIIDHSSPSLIVNPIGSRPHIQPSLLNNNDVITIENTHRLHPLYINLDGNDAIPITKKGEKVSYKIELAEAKVNLLIAENYVTKWDNKVREAQGFTSIR